MMIILKVFMNTIKKKQSIKPMLYIYGTWVKESDHNEFNYVLESNEVALVKKSLLYTCCINFLFMWICL